MKKLKIGIDIDDVICDSCVCILAAINGKFGTAIQISQMTSFYSFTHLFDGDQVVEVDKFLEESFSDDVFQYSFTPNLEAVSVIERWSKEGHSIHYITARPAHAREVTTKWLFDHGFMVEGATVDLFDTVRHESGAAYKSSLVKELNLDVMIEDSLGYIEHMKLPVLLIDQPWNQGDTAANVTRVKNWHEIDEHIRRRIT